LRNWDEIVDEILARVNESQSTLSQMLDAYNKKSELNSMALHMESNKKKRDEREHCSKTDATKRGVESATHRTPQKKKLQKDVRILGHNFIPKLY